MRLQVALIAALVLALFAATVAGAQPYVPPEGRIFSGVAGSEPFDRFARQVGKHPAVQQFFTYWGRDERWMTGDFADNRARGMVHVGSGTLGRETTTPGVVARGGGDRYIVGWNRIIADAGKPLYVRLFSEMNNYRNPYSAVDAAGRLRGGDHSHSNYIKAWRRFALIVRGGDVRAINARLAKLGMPRIARKALGRRNAISLPIPKVALMWVPMTAGSPDVALNRPQAYWPGSEFVDWVGTDFYSKFPNFSGLDRFYAQYGSKPFVFGEWALWGRDDPAFVDRFFSWVTSHKRVKMLVYNQGNRASGPFQLWRYPKGRAAIKRRLSSRLFLGNME